MRSHITGTAIVGVVLALSACSSTPIETSGTAGVTASTSADPEGTNTRLWIKPDLVDCEGEAPQKCMQVAESIDGEYLYFYDQIAGFTFVEGTSYVVDVRIDEVVDPPADASSLTYTLIEVVEEN